MTKEQYHQFVLAQIDQRLWLSLKQYETAKSQRDQIAAGRVNSSLSDLRRSLEAIYKINIKTKNKKPID